jgi:hypothetical protein
MLATRSYPPQWYWVNLDGTPLNDTFYLFVLNNTFPYVPATVWMDENMVNPWSNPIEFEASGELPDNIYWSPDPTLAYRLEIRQGPLQTDPLIYLIQNYVPNMSGNVTPSDLTVSEGNLISNPQFSQISFTSPLMITTAGNYNVAPGWTLALVGTGTATVTQVVTANSQNAIPATPPYFLQIVTNGWTSAILEQTFEGIGAFAQGTFFNMSAYLIANSGSPLMSFIYAPSSPGTPQNFFTGAITGTWTQYQGNITVAASSDSTLNSASYINMEIVLPSTGNVSISNVQITQVGSATVTNQPYLQQSLESQINQLFYYYEDSILIKPKNTLLTGWNFALNPFQFVAPAVATVVSQCSYVADQTILYQATASSVSTGQVTANNTETFSVGAILASNKFALIQYIDAASIAPYWGYSVSSLVRAILNSTQSSPSSVQLKMRLIWNTSIPSANSSTYPIASWAGTDPVFAAGFTAISPSNDPAYTLPTTYNTGLGGNAFPNFAFDDFILPKATTATQTLAIVIYSVGNMNQASPPAESILFDKISLVPNQFAIDTNPETWDESLRKCQYYYEKSLDNSIQPGTADAASFLTSSQYYVVTGTTPNWNASVYPSAFSFNFNVVKRAVPAILMYSPSAGTIGNVDAVFWDSSARAGLSLAVISNWSAPVVGTKGVVFTPFSVTPILSAAGFSQTTNVGTGFIEYHYSANARIGG